MKNCKAEKCDNVRCSCRKKNCTVHCHKGNPCKNRGPPEEISEIEKGEVALHSAWGPVLEIFNITQYYV